jgi:hypothetical protein
LRDKLPAGLVAEDTLAFNVQTKLSFDVMLPDL